MPKKVHAGSQQLQNIVGYGFPSKKKGSKSKKLPKKGARIIQSAKIGCMLFVYATGECFCIMNDSWKTKLVYLWTIEGCT